MSTPTATGTFEFALPSLGADMDRGRVVEWCVDVGDHVARGDIVAVVETEKSDIDVEIWHPGVVEEFLVELGAEIDVGTPIARLRGPGGGGGSGPSTEDVPSAGPAPASGPTPAATTNGSAVSAPDASPTPDDGVVTGGRRRSSPYARRLASERGVDLSTIDGSGPGGAVVAADVERTAVPAAPRRERPGGDGPTSMRRLIAQRMATSNREIPHYHLELDVDVTEALAALADYNDERSIADRVVPAAWYVHAVARALSEQPEFNGTWEDDAFVPGEAVNVAMAINLRTGGLVTPHIERADELDLATTMERLTELVAAARSGNLKSRWMTGGSITVTNLGDHGADLVHGVISPPQVALVGIGRPRRRPWVVDDHIEPRSIVTLTLAADHRATDGMAGSRFLNRIAHHLSRFPEDP